MKLPHDPGGHVWPGPAQERLLLAALAEDGSAQEHFLAWLAMVDIEGHVDEGTYRTLPLLWANLKRDGVDHPILPRFKGVLRNSWVQSTRQSAVAVSLLDWLHDSGIQTMVSKGLPLSLMVYEMPALRPMSDLDIIVPAGDAEQASRILEDKGFFPDRKAWPIEKALRHALMHKHESRGEIDLHWHVLYECPTRAADSHFWDSAVPIRIGEVETLRPAISDMLLHVLVHGIRWNLSPPMRWVPDAMMILRSREQIDWDRIADFGERHGLTRRLGLGLGYLRERFKAPVPEAVLARLDRRMGLVERMEMLAMRGTGPSSGWRHLRRGAYLLRLARSDDAANLPRAVLSEAFSRLRRPRRVSQVKAGPKAQAARQNR